MTLAALADSKSQGLSFLMNEVAIVGAVLVRYTDGLLERLSNDDEEFGLPRLTKLIVPHQQKSAQKIVEVIHTTVFDFGSQAKWKDDFTTGVVKKADFNGGPM